MKNHKQYFEEINRSANNMMINLIGIAFPFGALIYFLSRYFSLRIPLDQLITESLVIAIIGLLTLILKKVTIKSHNKTIAIGVVFSITYAYLFRITMEQSFTTAWAAAFIFICIALIYASRILVYMQVATVIIIEVGSFFFLEAKDVSLNGGDHIGRIGIVVLVLMVAYYVNRRYRNKLLDNLNQIDEITEQKEELTSLYEQVQANEEDLREQNDHLQETYTEIDRLAYYDSLTDLPKRRKLFEDIEHKVEQAEKSKGEHFTLILIDLDNFKNVNDLHGHDVGDHFLHYTADLIAEVTKDTPCKIYRIGSDDFVILTNNTRDAEAVVSLVNELIKSFEVPLEYELYSITSSISIGISEYPQNGNGAKTLLRNADMALHQAKAIGKGNYVFFDQKIEEKLIRKLNLQNALKAAIANNELALNYQPIVDLENRQIIGFEALLRWNSELYGQISPVEFIPFAEENMAIIPIGLWVVEESMKFIQGLNKEGNTEYKISVNVSTIQLNNRQFLNKLDELIRKYDFSTHLLDVEVTETTFMESFEESIILLNTLRELGITISLDDFGTGFSSLSYLQQLPVDHLKIDRSFITTLNADDNPLVETIINMAHRLHMEVIAEGIETVMQLETITHQQCNYGQGYLFSKPLPEDQVEAFINSYNETNKSYLD